MSLRQLQLDFFKSLQSGRIRSRALINLIAETRGISPTNRFECYQFAYYDRLIGALKADFEHTAKILGKTKFSTLAHDFAHRHPSTSYSLADLGHKFASFLAKKKQSLLVRELSRFEWAIAEAYYVNATPVTWQTDLANLSRHAPRDIFFVLDSSVHLMHTTYALHLCLEGKQVTKKKPCDILIYRNRRGFGWAIALNQDEARLLKAIERKSSLEKISRMKFERPDFLKTTFETWTKLGILCGILVPTVRRRPL